MNITIQDNLGIYYSPVRNRREVDMYVSNYGYVLTIINRQINLTIPDTSVNGQLISPHGVRGITMEVGKLLLAASGDISVEDIEGYSRLDKTKPLSITNVRMVSKERSELDIVRDFILNPEGLSNIYVQKGQVMGRASSMEKLASVTRYAVNEIVEAIIEGGGYGEIDDSLFSINRFLKQRKPYTTREAIVRFGRAGSYSTDTGERYVSCNTLSLLWEEVTGVAKSNLDVYKILSERGSRVSDSFSIKFQVFDKLHSIEPARATAPIMC